MNQASEGFGQDVIGLLENTHLIHRLLALGHGKQVLRARPKVSLADQAAA